MEENFERLREEMVERQLKARGIQEVRVLDAMRKIPRHKFVPKSIQDQAYGDHPLSIGFGQTISQPYIVARMAELAGLNPESKVLEIGTGSGYNAAIIGALSKVVYTVERIEPLADLAKDHLREIDCRNVFVTVADGSLGLKEEAPFDVIIVTAAAPNTPDSLLEQLATHGRLIIPVGDESSQKLLRYTKQENGGIDVAYLDFVRFVPLIGKEGWDV